MKKLIFLLVYCFNVNINAQTIYSVDYEYQSEIKVFVVEYEYQADLLVYNVDYNYQVDGNSGLWFFTDKGYQADFKIFFVDQKYKSDLNIFFVDQKYKAKWRSNEKKYLLY
jgi:hypothetical protein